jgi:riboflavin kinase/FMN adenylyltransferase
MKVYFIKRIRDEEKFNSMEELINQLKDDRNFAVNEQIKISF